MQIIYLQIHNSNYDYYYKEAGCAVYSNISLINTGSVAIFATFPHVRCFDYYNDSIKPCLKH